MRNDYFTENAESIISKNKDKSLFEKSKEISKQIESIGTDQLKIQ